MLKRKGRDGSVSSTITRILSPKKLTAHQRKGKELGLPAESMDAVEFLEGNGEEKKEEIVSMAYFVSV